VRAAHRVNVAESIQIGVAIELIQRGVEAFGAAARGHVDGGAGGAPVLRALVVGHHLELRDRVRRRLDNLVVEALVALAVGVVVHAVEQVVVEHAALAVHVVASRAHQAGHGGGGGRSWRLARARHQGQQVGVVAAHQRQRFGLIFRDSLAALAGLGLNCSATSLTSTVVASAWPTFSVRSIFCRTATEIGDVLGFSWRKVLAPPLQCCRRPRAATEPRSRPSRSATLFTLPVFTLVTVTVAFATAAPVASWMEPIRLPSSYCALALRHKMRSRGLPKGEFCNLKIGSSWLRGYSLPLTRS
jgi:hypothetical protein